MSDHTALADMLSLAVPLKMAELPTEDPEWLVRTARKAWGTDAATQHEALLYPVKAHTSGGKRVPGTAEVFAGFVLAVSCMALVAAGGITVAGMHFCPATIGAEACGRCP